MSSGLYCKACGYELGDPREDLHDPEGLSDVAQDMGGPIDNPDGAHLVVRDGKKGWRYYCGDTGQVTSIIEQPPSQEGEGGGSGQEPSPRPKRTDEEVYSLKEDKSALDVLQDVCESPFLGLNESQMEELKDWAEDYNGQIPPDIMEDVLGNFSGVQKQTAKLARQKYEVKLNRWVRDQTQQDDGPPIGVTARPRSPNNNRRNRERRQPQRRRSGGGGDAEREQQEGSTEEQSSMEQTMNRAANSGSLRDMRRRRRVMRRNEVLDKAAAQFAEEAGDEFAREFAGTFGDARDILYTFFKRKAEKDPDWLFEKMDKWDVDILDVVLEPSNTRKEEMAGEGGKPSVDSEVDDALDDIMSGEGVGSEVTETDKSEQGIPEDGEVQTDNNAGEGNEETEDPFEEHFGEIQN